MNVEWNTIEVEYNKGFQYISEKMFGSKTREDRSKENAFRSLAGRIAWTGVKSHRDQWRLRLPLKIGNRRIVRETGTAK